MAIAISRALTHQYVLMYHYMIINAMREHTEK